MAMSEPLLACSMTEGSTARVTRKVPVRLTRRHSSHRFNGVSKVGTHPQRAGVCHQNVDRAELVGGPGHRVLDRGLVGDVAHHRQRRPPPAVPMASATE